MTCYLVSSQRTEGGVVQALPVLKPVLSLPKDLSKDRHPYRLRLPLWGKHVTGSKLNLNG
jgi:hypothetical protein